MPHLTLSLFGSPLISLDGHPVSGFASKKALALLAYLAVDADRAHTREELAGLLWPDYAESSARANLRSVLANVRRAIGDREASPPFLTITRQGVQFNLECDHHLDVAIFQELSSTGALDAVATKQLEEAVNRMRGPFLAGFSIPDSPTFEEWILLRRAFFDRQVATTLVRLSRRYEDLGQYEQALRHAQRCVDMDPWQEEAHRQVMRLLVANGQRNEALIQFETCRRLLVEELGVEPTEETTNLYERIRTGRVAGTASSARQDPPHARFLPSPLTPLVGREKESAELSGLLSNPDQRLITLVGPGGIGKTHLSLVVAAACSGFADGVYFVPLAPLQSVDPLLASTAKALGFSFHDPLDPQRQLLDFLRRKELLLVMDNFEHLLAGAGLVVDILETAPRVKVLATSRLRLGVPGEQLYPLGGLAVPDEAEIVEPDSTDSLDRYAAVTLFAQTAQRLQPSFSLTDDNVAAVTRVCGLVAGMPLGIVLAASWIEMLEPCEIATEIEHSFGFLKSDQAGMPERQQSLEVVFEQSWKLLSAEEQAVFQKLTLFRGGFTRSAALAVVGASLADLLTLIHKFFLHRTSTGRFEIHELLRQFAAQKLSRSQPDQEAAGQRHSAYFLADLGQLEVDLRGVHQQEAIGEIEVESDNIRVAWQWAAEQGHLELLDQAVNSLGIFYEWQGRYDEGEAACRTVTGRSDLPKTASGCRITAKILCRQARFNRLLGNRYDARQQARQALSLLNDSIANGQDTRTEQAAVLLEMAQNVGNLAEATTLSEQSVDLYRSLADSWGLAEALVFLGNQTLNRFEPAENGEQFLSESLEIFERLGDRRGVAKVLKRSGMHANLHGRAEESENGSAVAWPSTNRWQTGQILLVHWERCPVL